MSISSLDGNVGLALLVGRPPGGVIGVAHLVRPLVLVGALPRPLGSSSLLLFLLAGLLVALLLTAPVFLVCHRASSRGGRPSPVPALPPIGKGADAMPSRGLAA